MVRKIELKSNYGITLIALVVTIAVLLILAGVSANLLFTDGNILQIAQASVESHKKAQIEEKLSIEIVNYKAEKLLNPKLNIEDFWQKLVQAGLINSPADITKEVIKEENKIVEANNKKKQTSLVAKLATTTPIKLASQVTNQVAQNIQQTLTSQKETYTITTKDGYVATVETDGDDNMTLKEVLTPSQAKARANTQSPNLITGTITVSAPIWTANENATVTLSTTTGLKMQWQKNSISGMWMEGTTVEGLRHGDTIFTRLIDDEGNAADEASVSILDSIVPELATITRLTLSTTIGEKELATVTHTDNQTKIDITKCKWLFNTTSTNLNVNNTVWNTADAFSNSTHPIIITVPSQPGDYYLHVLSVDIAGNKRETISHKVEVKRKAPILGTNPTNTPVENGYGRIDVIWLDENNNIIPQPKSPILGTTGNKMTPIKWDGTTEKTANEANSGNEWYEYKAITGNADNNASHWANAKTQNGSYFVWIPRYAYRITYYTSQTDQAKELGYYDGYGMWSEDGILRYSLEDGIETVEAADGYKYIVHPAFGAKQGSTQAQKTKNINNGGWGDTLTGFWFAKFEMSGTESTNLASTPGVQSLRSRTIGEFYTIGREATYGQTGTVDSFDNKTSFMNSHMAKNSEWGAVAYLTHSQYGRNGHEIAINRNSSFYTGGAQGETAYTNANNQKQSTTGNTYGIYDMSGGAYEYTAAWNTNTSSYISNGSSFATTGGASTKYATAYHGTSNNYGTDIYTVCKTGDATKEVYVSGTTGWFSDYSTFVYSSSPFFVRGGRFNNGSNAGVFYSYYNSGNSGSSHSFRAVLGFEAL